MRTIECNIFRVQPNPLIEKFSYSRRHFFNAKNYKNILTRAFDSILRKSPNKHSVSLVGRRGRWSRRTVLKYHEPVPLTFPGFPEDLGLTDMTCPFAPLAPLKPRRYSCPAH